MIVLVIELLALALSLVGLFAYRKHPVAGNLAMLVASTTFLITSVRHYRILAVLFAVFLIMDLRRLYKAVK